MLHADIKIISGPIYDDSVVLRLRDKIDKPLKKAWYLQNKFREKSFNYYLKW